MKRCPRTNLSLRPSVCASLGGIYAAVYLSKQRGSSMHFQSVNCGAAMFSNF